MNERPPFDYDVFVSYRRSDGKDVAQWLRHRLQSYRLPQKLAVGGRLPLAVYLDTAFERANEDFWLQNIEPALRRSRFLIVIVTPSVFQPASNGEQSWVDREIATFLALPQGRNILVATARGNPIDRLPEALRREFPRLDVVDLGAFGGRWSFAKTAYLNDQTLTLIAPTYDIADTEMPVIRQEEERRKRRVAIRIATGSLVLVFVLTALLAFALVQRQRAEERRVQAVAAQKDAEVQRNIAEDRRRQADAARDAERLQRLAAERERTAAEAKSLGLAALRDFDSGRQIEALIEAIQGGRKLESLAGSDAAFALYPTVEPLLALSRVLDRIRERNRLEHHEDSHRLQGARGVTNAGVCPAQERTAADVQRLMGQSGHILTQGCTPDGRYLVTTATDGTVRILDNTGSQQPELIGLQGAATLLAFASDSLHFRTTDVWGTDVDWDLSGANHGRSVTVLSSQKPVVTAISFAREAALFATGSRAGEIRLWTVAGHEASPPISTGKASVAALQLSPNGRLISSITEDGRIQRWDRSGKPAFPSINTGDSNIIDAAFRADGLAAASAIAGGSARVYDLATTKSTSVRGQHSGWIMGVAFHPAGDIVATAGADDTVGLAHISGQPFSRPIRANQGQVMSVAFSPDGKSLATGGDDGTVKLWTLSGMETGKLIGHEGKVLHVSFSSDGQLIATASSDGTVRLWLPSGEQVSQYEGQHGFLAEEALGGSFGGAGMSISPDGRTIAIADSTGAVRVRQIQKLGELVEQACAWLDAYLTTHHDAPHVCHGS